MTRRGISLMELVLAVFLMAMLVVMTAAVLHRNLKVMRKAEHTTRAAYLAQEKMEELMCLHSSHHGPHQGRFPAPLDGYTWRSHIHTIDETYADVTVDVEGPGGASYTLLAQRRRLPRVVWFASNREGGLFQLYRIQEDGEALVRATHTGSNEMQPAVSPDGSSVAFVSDRAGARQIWQMPLEGGDATLLVPTKEAQRPAWSPDGKRLAFSAPEGGYSHIFVLSLQSGVTTQITDGLQHEDAPVWSPDGQQLALVLQHGDGSQILLMDSDGSHPHAATPDTGWNTAPSFEPDGRHLLFMSNRDGNPELYEQDLVDGTTRRLTNNPAYDSGPQMSPDGKRIVFWSTRDGGTQLFVMRPDAGAGEKPLRLVPKSATPSRTYTEDDASWEP